MKNGTTTTLCVFVNFCQSAPGRLLHVNVEHCGIFSECADLFRLALRRDGTVFIQIGSVSNDQQTRLGRIDIGATSLRALAAAAPSSVDDFRPARNISKSVRLIVS